jgi:hypothetical protein
VPLVIEKIKKTAPTEAFGGTIDASQESKPEVLAKRIIERERHNEAESGYKPTPHAHPRGG